MADTSNPEEATTAVPSSAGDQAQTSGTSTPARAASQCGTSSVYTAQQSDRQLDVDGEHTTHTSPSFRGSKICVAIDVSASTYGDVLAAEKRATLAICKLIPLKLRPSINIIPWNHDCGIPVSLKQIDSLHSEGATDPTVFLDDPTSRDILQESDFWFLMTDGDIEESVVRQFARGIRGYGLHGKACVICLFGEGEDTPSNCNVSVGISVFAGSPHAAFLFHNVETQKTYILQTKGCFSALLPYGTSAPRLDDTTTWEDLPQTSFENLSRVHVPPSVKVDANEIILQDNSRLDMAAFLRDLPEDENTVAQILDNEENLNSVAVAAKLREETGRLRSWLDRLDARYGDISMGAEAGPTSTLSATIESRSKQALAGWSKQDILGMPTFEEDHHGGLADFSPAMQDVSTQRRLSNSSVVPQHCRSSRRSSGVHMRRISDGGLETAADNLGRPGPFKYGSSSSGSNRVESAPGFTKSRRTSTPYQAVKGCMDCTEKSDIYCVLLRAQSRELTVNFPKPGTQSIVAFPLAMGNYAETDSLASVVVCDTCANRRLQRSRIGQDGSVVASLPLLSYSNNRTAWLDTIDLALSKRFHSSQLPVIFLGILYIKLEKLLSEGRHTLSDLSEAIKWIANMLLSEVVLQPSKILAINKFGIGALHDVLLRSFIATRSKSSYTELLQYPLDGFVVANAALSNSKHAPNFSGSKRKGVVFLKFLYHLTENFFRFRADNDAVVTEAAKALVLLSDEPTGPSSLFKWKEIKSLSIRFKDATELRKYFSQRGSYKLALTTNDLKVTPFLSEDDLHAFERLGVLFNWITNQASHATAVFVHHLLRSDIQGASVEQCFTELREELTVSDMLKDPADISAKKAEEMIRQLPPL